MTNQAKNVPELRFPEFDGEWEEKQLNNIVDSLKGNSNDNEELPVLTISAKKGWMNQKERFSQVIAGNSLSKYNELKKGDLSYNKGNSKVAIYGIVYKLNYDRALVPNVYKSFRPKSNYESDFIEKYFHTKILDKQLRKLITSTARMDGLLNISDNDFYSMLINIPTKKEQRKIGDFFSKLDRQIELEEQKLEKLEAQKKGYMQQIFSHQLIFKDKNGATYPEWKTLKIKDIAEILRGLTYKPEDIRVAGIRVLRSSNIIKDKFHTYKDDIFVDKSVVKIPLVNKGDILITAANGSPKLVGKHAIIEKLDDESVAGGFMYILRSDNSKFIQIWMSTMEYKRIISRVQGGNGSIGNLSRNDLENGYITLPCDEEQNKIGNFFNKFDELIEKQNQKIDGLKERKKGFLQKMFV